MQTKLSNAGKNSICVFRVMHDILIVVTEVNFKLVKGIRNVFYEKIAGFCYQFPKNDVYFFH